MSSAPAAAAIRTGRQRGTPPRRSSLGEGPDGRPAAPGALEEQERFAAYVAHELRAPVALQRALVEVALADPHADATTLREMGERVVASCVRQQRLIEALLELVRSGCGLRRREPVDLAALAAEALGAHDPSGLESVVAFEPARTAGDPDLLGRLAANLISNAIDHNLARGRIEIATRTRSGRAVISVTNTGLPISPGELPRLFRPFERLGPHPGPSADGVGLGLAVVRAIADAHDAAVTARARRGGGLGIAVAFAALD